ncbi:hypothetical protein J2T55_001804 [Methylohalomonas lacus]|uniref:DUF7931 domain-containing protein n=1 Tax=Methylohalomonas lacus TaxID=398773 RepID=A0AAE3L4F5_9GAMM|nr:hypothetical protein [Methylohalomonas lacus]MCS3903773.1 hypothetical protein [Methylohalomonas lacus]
MYQFDQYSLGQTDSELELDSREHNQLASQAMVRQARRSLDIASRQLDPSVYDQPDFIAAVKRMILDNRRCQVRVLVFEAQAIARRGHQLLQLAGDLSSFIELRQAARQHDDYGEALLVADRCGYIHRPLGNRYEAGANFSARRRAQALLNTFEDMWAHASSSVYLRRLSL